MFDTKLPPGVTMLQPFSEESSIKKIAVQVSIGFGGIIKNKPIVRLSIRYFFSQFSMLNIFVSESLKVFQGIWEPQPLWNKSMLSLLHFDIKGYDVLKEYLVTEIFNCSLWRFKGMIWRTDFFKNNFKEPFVFLLL